MTKPTSEERVPIYHHPAFSKPTRNTSAKDREQIAKIASLSPAAKLALIAKMAERLGRLQQLLDELKEQQGGEFLARSLTKSLETPKE